jgi:Protein of unknown function (DUF2281)
LYFYLILHIELRRMDNVVLYSKLAILPESMKSEVSNFIDFLLLKAEKEKKDISIPQPIFGSAKGMFVVSADFDEPLEDFKDDMGQ